MRVLLTLVVCGLALAVTPATGAKPKPFRITAHVAQVEARDGFPAVGGSLVAAGPQVTTRPFGAGAEIDRLTVTGHPSDNTFEYAGTGRNFYDGGVVKSTFRGTLTVNADGSIDDRGSGRIIGGTQRYRGARGKYTYTGDGEPGSRVETLRVRGTYSLPAP